MMDAASRKARCVRRQDERAGQACTISAWIFDWDGVFVDSEMWKAWSYGLGISEVWETLSGWRHPGSISP